ncbi:hypothetical protein OAP63_00415 [Vibrio sp.]|uniref:Uncharacterized protein n=1 Tax=Vibrio viridaestus TaxID=2487322 RepID=A0A3N9TDN6_9VIBR|nr:hypothetical protein [Vibrio viridaestus]MDC0609170.1 hypothetical protein [Vibrio sp.]RQW62327.1 hypothetical protein EES38_14195 [Vibrio viridaestus]
MKRGLYRLANPSDYEFNEELGLWELSFDTRPIAGTRCEDPVEGAILYNEKRKRFVETYMRVQKELKNRPVQVFDFNEVMAWALTDDADAKQCWYICKLLDADNMQTYCQTALDFMRDEESPLPHHMEIAVYFNGFKQRLSVGSELIKAIENKAGVSASTAKSAAK